MDLGQRTVIITLICNLLLAVAKALIGILSGSIAMVTEATHSGMDVLASSGVLLGLAIARKPPDASHPYGHGKVEGLVGLGIAAILVFVGCNLGVSAATFLKGSGRVPGVSALWMALLSIPIKEAMYWYTVRVARKLQSVALMADAWHHRADAIISLAVLAGIAGARMGFPLADPLASLAICVLIIRVGVRIAVRALDQLTDACPGQDRIEYIAKLVESVPSVREVHCVKARMYGPALHIDITIGVDQDLKVKEGHSIAATVRESLRNSLPEVSEVLIHVSPCGHGPEDSVLAGNLASRGLRETRGTRFLQRILVRGSLD